MTPPPALGGGGDSELLREDQRAARWSGDPLGTLLSLNTLDALITLRSLRTGFAGVALHTLVARVPLRSLNALVPLLALVAVGTLDPLDALLALVAVDALGALDPLLALVAFSALDPLDALSALVAFDALRALLTDESPMHRRLRVRAGAVGADDAHLIAALLHARVDHAGIRVAPVGRGRRRVRGHDSRNQERASDRRNRIRSIHSVVVSLRRLCQLMRYKRQRKARTATVPIDLSMNWRLVRREVTEIRHREGQRRRISDTAREAGHRTGRFTLAGRVRYLEPDLPGVQ